MAAPGNAAPACDVNAIAPGDRKQPPAPHAKEHVMITKLFLAAIATSISAGALSAQSIYPTRMEAPAFTPVQRACTQLERSVGLDESRCGTVPLGTIVRLKAEQEQVDGEDN
jgi:hypothetical protein